MRDARLIGQTIDVVSLDSTTVKVHPEYWPGNAHDATEGRWLLEGIGPIEHTASL
jgi:hypothetical protein